MSKQENTLRLADIDSQLAATTNDTLNWQAQMRAVVANAIGEVDVQEIIQKQVAKAKAGDVVAAKFIMSQVLGLGTPVKITQTNVITDVETAARIAKQNRAVG